MSTSQDNNMEIWRITGGAGERLAAPAELERTGELFAAESLVDANAAAIERTRQAAVAAEQDGHLSHGPGIDRAFEIRRQAQLATEQQELAVRRAQQRVNLEAEAS